MSLHVETGLRGFWDALVADHPLPRGYRVVVEGSAPDRAGAVSLAWRRWSDPPASAPATVIGTRPVAPAVDLLAPTEDVPRARLGGTGAPDVLPLDEVSLPRRLVSVDGRFPDAADYPLYDELLLSLSSREAALKSWFSALPSVRRTPPRILWVAAVGDVMLDRGVDQLILRDEGGLTAVFGDTLPVLRGADVLIGNLESAVTTRGAPAAKAYTFRIAPQALSALKTAGFSYLSAVNNHSFDYGPDGFVDTLEYLRASGIGTSGAGRNAAEALEPFAAGRAGQEIRIWSLGAYPAESSGFDGRAATAASATRPGVLWADDETLQALAARLGPRQGAGPAVVTVHGGEEWQSAPSSSQRALYRRLASSGAALVLGSHPHVLQGIEVFGGSLIVYSLGNFVFPGMQSMAGATDSVIAVFGFLNGRVVALRLVSVTLSGTTVRLAKAPVGHDRILALSRALADGASPR